MVSTLQWSKSRSKPLSLISHLSTMSKVVRDEKDFEEAKEGIEKVVAKHKGVEHASTPLMI